MDKFLKIASKFEIEGTIEEIKPLGPGFINDTFIVKTVELQKPVSVVPSLAGSFTVYMCIEGEAALKMNDNASYMIAKGETILVPASMDDFTLVPVNGTALLLEITMPQLAEEPDTYLNYDEPEDEAHGSYKDTVPAEDDDDDDVIYADSNVELVGSTEEVLEAGFVIDEDGPEDIMDVFDGAEADDDTYDAYED